MDTVFTLINARGVDIYFSDFTFNFSDFSDFTLNFSDFTLNFSDFTLKSLILNKMYILSI